MSETNWKCIEGLNYNHRFESESQNRDYMLGTLQIFGNITHITHIFGTGLKGIPVNKKGPLNVILLNRIHNTIEYSPTIKVNRSKYGRLM